MPHFPPRTYGFWTGTFVVAASMVGSGILMTPGQTLQETSSPAALFVLWSVGGLMALAGALSVAELGAALPHAGGDYVFVRAAFGNAWAFVFGWSCLLFTFAGPIALIAVLTVEYIAPTSIIANRNTVYLAATAIIAVFTLLHSLGQRESAWVQNLTTVIKLAIFFIFAALGLLIGDGSMQHFSEGLPIKEKGGWSTLAINLTYVLYAYSGWNGAAYLAGEIREPHKNLPRSLIAGSLLVMALYLLMNAVYVFALSPADLENVPKEQARVVAWLAGEKLFGSNVSRILSIIFGIGMLATISALLFTAPRIAYMMAKDRLMPSAVGWLHPTGHTPVLATCLVGVLSVLLLWSGSFGQILDFTSVGLTALSGLTVASLFPLRARGDWLSRFRTPLYPLPPLFFLVLTGFTVVLAIQTDSNPIPISLPFMEREWSVAVGALSIAAIALGFPLYAIYVALAGAPSPASEIHMVDSSEQIE